MVAVAVRDAMLGVAATVRVTEPLPVPPVVLSASQGWLLDAVHAASPAEAVTVTACVPPAEGTCQLVGVTVKVGGATTVRAAASEADWPSGLVTVRVRLPGAAPAVLSVSVTCVGELTVTPVTVTFEPLKAAESRLAKPGPGSKNPDPDDAVPVTVTVTSACPEVTVAGLTVVMVAGGGGRSFTRRMAQRLSAATYSCSVHMVMSSFGSTLVYE